MKAIFVVLCVVMVKVLAHADDANTDIVSARIESCSGCSLNRLPDVRAFIMNDASTYDRVEVKFINGAMPELVLLGAADKELERLPLKDLNREQCNDLILKKGFTKKPKSELQV